jgi:DNA polymerase-3 subunit epsilon
MGNMNWKKRKMIGFDTETTGLDPVNDRIIQLAACVYDPLAVKFGESFVVLCGSDGVEMSRGAANTHGISPDQIVGLPSCDARLSQFVGWLERQTKDGCAFVAYNAPFDLAFLTAACKRIGFNAGSFPIDPARVVDPLTFARTCWRTNKLSELAGRLGVLQEKAHDALDDVKTTIKVLLHLSNKLDLSDDFEAVLEEQERSIETWERTVRHRYRDQMRKVMFVAPKGVVVP